MFISDSTTVKSERDSALSTFVLGSRNCPCAKHILSAQTTSSLTSVSLPHRTSPARVPASPGAVPRTTLLPPRATAASRCHSPGRNPPGKYQLRPGLTMMRCGNVSCGCPRDSTRMAASFRSTGPGCWQARGGAGRDARHVRAGGDALESANGGGGGDFRERQETSQTPGETRRRPPK